MKARVTKTFTLDAAHMIPNHDGKCRNLHGHTYKIEVTVKGNVQLKDPDASNYGMVRDFSEIKQIFKDHIEPLMDHRYLNDTLPISVTTAEMIAGWIWETYLNHGVAPCRVVVWETPTSSAEVTNGDLI